MRNFASIVLVFTATTVWAQERETQSNPSDAIAAEQSRAGKIPNPFDAGGLGGGMEMMDSGMGDVEEMMGAAMDMGMGGMGGMGMGMGGMSGVDRFQLGLQRAIKMLGNAKTESHRTVLQGYIRDALETRYEDIIAKRRKDLERLKRSVAELEDELNRREAAKDRVVGVQMQSVQLAAEGLLNLTDLQGVSRSPGYSAGGDMMEFDDAGN